MSDAGHQVAPLVVHVPLEQRGADAVREAAEHLPVGEQRVEQPPGVVDGDVVEHASPRPVSRSTSTTRRCRR